MSCSCDPPVLLRDARPPCGPCLRLKPALRSASASGGALAAPGRLGQEGLAQLGLEVQEVHEGRGLPRGWPRVQRAPGEHSRVRGRGPPEPPPPRLLPGQLCGPSRAGRRGCRDTRDPPPAGQRGAGAKRGQARSNGGPAPQDALTTRSGWGHGPGRRPGPCDRGVGQWGQWVQGRDSHARAQRGRPAPLHLHRRLGRLLLGPSLGQAVPADGQEGRQRPVRHEASSEPLGGWKRPLIPAAPVEQAPGAAPAQGSRSCGTEAGQREGEQRPPS